MAKFLGKHKLSKVIQGEINDFNNALSTKEIEFVVNIHPI